MDKSFSWSNASNSYDVCWDPRPNALASISILNKRISAAVTRSSASALAILVVIVLVKRAFVAICFILTQPIPKSQGRTPPLIVDTNSDRIGSTLRRDFNTVECPGCSPDEWP